MLIGYMRVSSRDDRQTTALQRDALLQAGVDPRHLFEDKLSGAQDERPGLVKALAFLQPGDTRVVIAGPSSAWLDSVTKWLYRDSGSAMRIGNSHAPGIHNAELIPDDAAPLDRD